MREHFDVVVAGGGTAGCVLAARLSEERRVCLVEAGPDYGPYVDGRWPADILDRRWLALSSHCWARTGDDRSELRARILGGCSAHNACVLARGAPSDYEWGHGWSYDVLAPYLDRGEREMRGRRVPPGELTPWHAAFVEAAGDDVYDHAFNSVDSVRWNAAFAYLDPIRDRPTLTILAEALVDRVLLDGGRATGVLTSRGEVGADAVVLTAGAYGTPGILLRSGIGPDSGLPVGEGLTDHVGVGMGWEPTELLQRDAAAFETRGELTMAGPTVRGRSRSCPDDVCDLFMFPAIEPGYQISAAVFAMKPHSRGSVRLTSPDPEAPLAVDHGFLSDPRDADVVAEGVARLRELAATEPVKRYAARELRPGPDADVLEYVRAEARGFFHPTGTCALGPVADAEGRVHGFTNLHVADASFLPEIPRANTNLTVAAVADRLAELL
jgi:choline dehydrogenase